MTALNTEWPNFDGVPDEDSLISARPRGQKLARYVWWDGEVREADSLSIHYYANALHYGTAVFEGIHYYPTERGAALVHLQDHVERLISSARLYGMKLPFGADELARGALEVTRRNGMQNGYLRPLAYFGACTTRSKKPWLPICDLRISISVCNRYKATPERPPSRRSFSFMASRAFRNASWTGVGFSLPSTWTV